jgi:hypothetical protein
MDAYEGYGNADLGDKRLGARLQKMIGQLAANPSASISAACRDPHQAKAAYRLVGNDGVTVEAITKAAHDVTMKNIQEANPPVVLVVQDTSELNYSNLKATDGLGSISGRRTARGIEVHSAIAVSEAGEVFGLLDQKLWTRPPEEFGQSSPARCKETPIEEKESYKWLEAMDGVGAGFPGGVKAVHVCDREGDIYELFCKAEKDGALFLCRRSFNRNIDDDGGSKKLDDLIRSQPEAGSVTIPVPRDSHTGRVAREAAVSIKFAMCRIKRPRPLAKHAGLPESVEAYFVTAEELNPPQGQEKIFWRLITNVPTESFTDALKRIQWYTQRWKIEIFHRTLKDGCKVEELQSKTVEKLKKLVAIYSIIALQIMHLGYMARAHPDASCEACFTEEEWKVLHRVANKTKTLPERPPTIQEAVVMVAKLGGFLARKSDGFPGVTVVWRGLTSFYTILDAVPFLM